MSLFLDVFNNQAYLSILQQCQYIICNLGLWIPTRLCRKQLCPMSSVLCPGTQACSTQHTAPDGHVHRAVHYRCVGTCVHVGTETVLLVVIPLPLNDGSYNHSMRSCWSTGRMAGVHFLDPGPHLMQCPLGIGRALWGSWAQETVISSHTQKLVPDKRKTDSSHVLINVVLLLRSGKEGFISHPKLLICRVEAQKADIQVG